MTVSAVSKNDFRSLLYLISVSVVGPTIVGVLLGVGFLWLTDSEQATPSANPVLSAQALEAHEIRPPGNDATAWDSSPELPGDMIASPIPDAPTDRQVTALRSTAMDTAVIPPAGVTRARRVRIDWHRHREIGKHWAVSWRPDASAGPNPGGGFYGAPNVNVGRINPR
jgi:hypothetical protein